MGLLIADAEEAPVSGFSVDTSSRNSVLSLYHQGYIPSEGAESVHGWTGDVDACDEGDVSVAFRNHVLRRINYYRAMAGLSSTITFDATKNAKAQKAALIMAYEKALSHSPGINFPTNPCLSTDGIEAAGKGNLSLGSFGPSAIEGQLIDDGLHNNVAGHRRWILYSQAQEMGVGDIPVDAPNFPYSANCLWVIGDFTDAPNPSPEIAWPPKGFVPHHLAPNDTQAYPRWSYGYHAADFSSATVSMTKGGNAVSVVQESVQNGYGDNTLVWRPSGIPAEASDSDITYQVTINGIANAPFTSRTYDVTLIDPFRLGDEITVTGQGVPNLGLANQYSFNTISGADSYRVCIAEPAAGSWTEGAETAPLPNVADGTDAAYSLLSSTYKASGAKAFHLATPASGSADSFAVERDIVPAAGSEIQFKYRRVFMHPDTKLRVQVSRDQGQRFRTIHTIDGNNLGSSAQWDPSSFLSASVAIPSAYQNRPIRIRFLLEPTGSTFVGSSSSYGIHIDDISVTNHQEFTCLEFQDLAGDASSFEFTPVIAGKDYLLMVKPELGGRYWEYGPVKAVQSSPALTQLSIVDRSVPENAGTASFAIQLTPPSPVSVTVDFATSDGSAQAGSDYTAISGQKTFLAGQTLLTVDVPILADSDVEGDETYFLTLSNPVNSNLDDAVATGTISAPIILPQYTSFQSFATAHGLSGDPMEDSDDDMVADFSEWALGETDPTLPDSFPTQHLRFQPLSGDNYLTLCYIRLTGGEETASNYERFGGVTYRGVGSIDLIEFDQVPEHVAAPAGLPAAPAGFEWGCVRFPSKIKDVPSGFLKMEVLLAP